MQTDFEWTGSACKTMHTYTCTIHVQYLHSQSTLDPLSFQGPAQMQGIRDAAQRGSVMGPSPALRLDFVTAMIYATQSGIAVMILRKLTALGKVKQTLL